MRSHPPPDSVRKEMAALSGNAATFEKHAAYEQQVIPESVLQKIDELPEEQMRNRVLSIRQKFKLIDTDGNGSLDVDEFYELCCSLNMSKEQLYADFKRLDTDNSGDIDFEEFLGWWKDKAKSSQEFSDLFDDIGRKEANVKIKAPDVRPTVETQNLQVQKFFNVGLRGRKLYHIEVLGTRLSVYRSKLDRDEKTRLQLTDEQVVGVHAIPQGDDMKTGFAVDVLLAGKPYTIDFKFEGDGRQANIRQLDSWVGLINLAIKDRHENRSGEELWRLARNRAPLIRDVMRFLGDTWMGFQPIELDTEDMSVEEMEQQTQQELLILPEKEVRLSCRSLVSCLQTSVCNQLDSQTARLLSANEQMTAVSCGIQMMHLETSSLYPWGCFMSVRAFLLLGAYQHILRPTNSTGYSRPKQQVFDGVGRAADHLPAQRVLLRPYSRLFFGGS